MTNRQRIELRRSEIRQRLSEIAGTTGDELTDALKGERDTLLTELSDSEPQLRAAIEAEETEIRQRGDQATNDGESAEFRAIRERSRLTAYVREAQSQSPVREAEPEAELRAAVFGDHARAGLVPWQILDPGPTETRADVATDISGNAGAMSNPVLARIFALGDAVYLGTRFDSVDRGVAAYPVLTNGAAGAMAAKGAAVDATAGTVSIQTLEPRRLQARYLFNVEDLARIDTLEESLRSDLAMSLSEAMDLQVMTGDGTAPNVAGLLSVLAQPDRPAARSNFEDIIGLSSGAIEGRYAKTLRDVRLVVAADVYNLSSRLLNTSGDLLAADYLLERSGGIRASALLPSAPASGARTGQGEVLGFRSLAPGSAVAAVWSGFEMTLRDDLTGAAEGRIALTMFALWNFAALRSDAYVRPAVRIT